MKRLLIALLMLCFITTASAQNITTAEYFFDTDPGCGNGTVLAISSPGTTVNFPLNITTNNLSAGFHSLAIRVRTADGIWSFSDRRGFFISSSTSNTTNITAAEYFFDIDPGNGNGTPIPTGAVGAAVNFTAMIPASLSTGFHFLCIRTKDAEGKWGFFESRGFYIRPTPVNMPIITAAEYFYDNDPGVGNGTALTVSTPANIVTQTFMIPVPASMSAGDHLLVIRVKDEAGNWSLFEKDTLTVGNIATIACPGNIAVNASAGLCTAVVNNIDPTVSPEGSSFTYTLTGATTGSGNGSASGHTFNAGVTTVTYATANSPSTNCSFTITVNTNVVPSVSITTSQTTICSGTQATFTATSTNGGTPTYQWKLNGNNVGDGSNMYENSNLVSGDEIKVVMTSSLGCALPQSVTSNGITMTVLQSSPASVSIVPSATTICSGTTVTFTASPMGGGTPTYQWKLNGNNVGNGGPTYTDSSLQNGDKIKVIMTPSSPCAFPSPVASNEITMTVNSSGPASVSIAASQTSICPGQLVTFTATLTNGGTDPAFEWTLNGSVVGSDTSVYQTTSLANGDVVRLTMQPYGSCAANAAVYSNSITMTVGAGVTPSVTIVASAIDICAGTQVTFTANPTNGGSTPHYQWKLNGNNVGGDSAVYRSSTLAQDDTIKVVMTSSLGCVTSPTATSNNISMDVSAAVTPSVIIVASQTAICSGQQVVFTATPTNGGTPLYQWKLNGNIIPGATSATYQSSTLINNDVVSVSMTSSLPCAIPSNAISNSLTMSVTPSTIFYADFDGDGYGNGTSGVTEACTAPAGYVSNNGDCNDGNSSIHPGATEICGNSIDDDCDGQIDENCTASPDNDNDGYTVAQGDCNDNNAAVHPGATEICGNNIDDDCDGQIDENCVSSPDNDNDGYTVAEGDCNDNNAAVHPGAAEICGNGIDENCNGSTDENCNTNLPVLILRTHPVKEGDAGQTLLNVVVTLDIPAPSPVTVNYSTVNEDAVAGLDYTATSGSLLIPAGSISGTIQVRIIGDVVRESNERFKLNFTNPVNVIINGDPYNKIMIIDDDKGKNSSNAITRIDKIPAEEELLKVPSVTRRNEVWLIPQIGSYENEVLILNTQGQLVHSFTNYRNQTQLGNFATGLYFYRIQIKQRNGQSKYYTGRLMITQ